MQILPLTIIIPAHNAAKTIVRTLDSLAAQTAAEFEVICLDDASSDETPAVIADYLAHHGNANWHLLRQEENCGVSATRNRGIEEAHGEFIMFLDADDCLTADCCEHLLRLQATSQADLILANAWRQDTSGARRLHFPALGETAIPWTLGRDMDADLAFQPFLDTCWAKLFRRSLLQDKHLRFSADLSFGEDTFFTLKAALAAQSCVLDSGHPVYVYAENPQSCVHTIDAARRLGDLRRLLLSLAAATGPERSYFLLRKSKEYLWTIKRFGGTDRAQLLEKLAQDVELRRLLTSVISQYGKWKHRWLLPRLLGGHAWLLRFW